LLHLFVAEITKLAVNERTELHQQLDKLDGITEAARRPRLIDPDEFCSAAQVIRNLPPPRVPMFRGLSQFVSNTLTKACDRKGVRVERDGRLFPKAVIHEEKLEDKIRQYAAGLKLRQILPFMRKGRR
jgi:hypothetical protein